MHRNFLPGLARALGGNDDADGTDRQRQVHDLLTNAETVLKLYHWADDRISATFNPRDSPASLQQNHEADIQKVKDVMLIGKRLCAGELESIEHQARAKELMGRKEAFEQAAGIFSGPKEDSDGSVDRTLECVERGVRRIVKGME